MNPSILVVEDDRALCDLLTWNLSAEGYEVRSTGDGEEALLMVREQLPDAIILDWMIEQVPGIEVCRQLRKDRETAAIPIVMLTARGEEEDRIRGLKTGADDYVTKPFSPRELVLRIKKLLARTKAADEPAALLRLGELEIDVPRHSVTIGGTAVNLTATEFKLLEILARRRGRVQTRERLLQDVWGYENPIDSRTVDTHMRRLREKIGDVARHLETIRGVGYRFKAEE